MNQCIEYIFQEELHKKLFEDLKQIKNILEKKNYLNNNNFFLIEKYIYDFSHQKSGLIKQIINLMLEAESKASGSFYEILTNLIKNNFDIKFDVSNIKSTLTIEDIQDLFVFNNIENHTIKSMLFDAVKTAGFNGKIIVERSNDMMLEKSNGCTFFVSNIDTKFFGKYQKIRVCLIDGFIESVAEINQLFESFHASQETLLLFYRGAAEEVLQTISVNWSRNTLKVIPILVPFDLKGMNMLNDLAIACCTDVVSSLKGQLISTIKHEMCTVVDYVEVFGNKIMISKKGNKNNIQQHVNNLTKKRNDSIDDVADLYNERIKMLSTNLVICRVKDDIFYLQNRQKIDKFLRSYKNLIDDGWVEVDGKKMLKTTANIAQSYLLIIKNQIDNIGCVLNLVDIKGKNDRA